MIIPDSTLETTKGPVAIGDQELHIGPSSFIFKKKREAQQPNLNWHLKCFMLCVVQLVEEETSEKNGLTHSLSRWFIDYVPPAATRA